MLLRAVEPWQFHQQVKQVPGSLENGTTFCFWACWVLWLFPASSMEDGIVRVCFGPIDIDRPPPCLLGTRGKDIHRMDYYASRVPIEKLYRPPGGYLGNGETRYCLRDSFLFFFESPLVMASYFFGTACKASIRVPSSSS